MTRRKGNIATPVSDVKKVRAVVRLLLAWYHRDMRDFPWRRPGMQPWQVLLVEILLKQTQATRVADFVPRLFKHYPTLESFVDEDDRNLAEHLSPLGLQNERSKTLKEVAKQLLERGGKPPNTKEELLALPGVGAYIAAAYLSAVLDRPVPAVDVNMARLVERLFGPRTLVDIRYDPHINEHAQQLAESAPSARDLNWAVMDFCASRCTARNPRCPGCPLLPHCQFGRGRLASCTTGSGGTTGTKSPE